jgi:phosphoglycerate-specific signal transduction histidine kinase
MRFMASLPLSKKLLVAPLVTAILLIAQSGATFLDSRKQSSAMDNILDTRIPALQATYESDRALSDAHAGIYRLLSQVNANFPHEQLIMQRAVF